TGGGVRLCRYFARLSCLLLRLLAPDGLAVCPAARSHASGSRRLLDIVHGLRWPRSAQHTGDAVSYAFTRPSVAFLGGCSHSRHLWHRVLHGAPAHDDLPELL